MAKRVIHQYERKHGLGNWGRTQANTRVVSAGCDNIDSIAFQIDGLTWQRDTRSRLERDARYDFLTRGNTAQHTACMVRFEPARRKLISMLRTSLFNRSEPIADLHSLHRI